MAHPQPHDTPPHGADARIVVIGASAGGIETLREILHALPSDFPGSVFVTVHIPAASPSVLPAILNRAGPLRALPVVDDERIEPGRIYVAPPDHHLVIKRGYLRTVRGPSENGHRPAADPMFRSAAAAYGPAVIGVVLSGNLDDGTQGLLAVKRRGGVAVVQSPEEAAYAGMPRSAIEHVAVDHVLPRGEIAATLDRLVREPLPNEEDEAMSDEVDRPDDVELNNADADNVARGGVASGYTCPECSGALWEIQDGALVRYRCRTGHAYGETSLLGEQARTMEQALWTAYTALEENAALARRMAERARRGGRDRSAAEYTERAVVIEQRAQVIRRVLVGGPAAPPVAAAGD